MFTLRTIFYVVAYAVYVTYNILYCNLQGLCYVKHSNFLIHTVDTRSSRSQTGAPHRADRWPAYVSPVWGRVLSRLQEIGHIKGIRNHF